MTERSSSFDGRIRVADLFVQKGEIMKIMTVVILAILMTSSAVFAEEYKVKVVQKGGNLYWAATEKMVIQTEYCFEGADPAVLLLRMDGDSG